MSIDNIALVFFAYLLNKTVHDNQKLIFYV